MERRILRETAIKLLKDLVNTPSVTGNEAEIASLIRERMEEIGYKAIIDEAGNVISQLGNGTPRVLLSGHMDTVNGNLPITLIDGVLTGRGAVDAKGPLAALILGGYLAYMEGFNGSMFVAALVDEEGQNRGVKELIEKDLKVDYAVFGEPSNVNSITIGYKGAFSIRVKLTTEAGHSSAPWLYINAIEAGMDLFNSIKTIVTSISDETDGINALTITLRNIQGGDSFGSIPNTCEMRMGFRIPFHIETHTVIEMVKDQVTEFNSNNPKINVTLEIIDQVEPFLADKKSKLVKAFNRAIYSQTKDIVPIVKKSGTGDMNYYGNATKTPCITYGPGDPHLDHTDSEQIKIEDYLTAIKIISQALILLEKLHST